MTNWYEISNATEIPSPSLLIYPDRIRANLDRMIEYAGDVSHLRPHVKTHKMSKVIEMKLDAGITKFKTSTIAESEMTAEAGAADILMAYQPVGPNCDRLAKLAKQFSAATFSTIVDNPKSLLELSQAASKYEVSIPVFVDLNVGMNRTGIEIGAPAKRLYQSISDHSHLSAGGLHAYDGHLHLSDYELLCKKAEQTFEPVWKFRDELLAAGYEVPTVVTSGTPTSKYLAETQTVEVSAGTIVLWDFGYAQLCPQYDFQPAATLLARVISRPAKDLLCIDLGHKGIAAESSPPHVCFFDLEDAVAVGHNEEHLVLETDKANDFEVGAVVYGIPRHICPTVALYQEALCVRDGRVEEAWEVTARNRRITV